MKTYLIIILSLSLFGCKKNDPIKAIPKKDITFNEALYLIQEHRQFELNNNKDFNNTLVIESNKYYTDVTNNFIEKEYTMSGSFSELGIISNKTPEERFIIWEAKINNYFSSLAYTRFIKSKTENHSRNINKQRNKELEDVFNYINEDSLVMEKISLNVFQASKESVNLSIEKANESIKENLKAVAYATADVGSIIVTAGTSTVVIGSVQVAGVGEMAYDFIVPTKDETKEILIQEYSNFLEKNNINFTELLNINTNEYYGNLLKLIQKRKNEKIHY